MQAYTGNISIIACLEVIQKVGITKQPTFLLQIAPSSIISQNFNSLSPLHPDTIISASQRHPPVSNTRFYFENNLFFILKQAFLYLRKVLCCAIIERSLIILLASS